MQNIGAYGCEAKDAIERAHVLRGKLQMHDARSPRTAVSVTAKASSSTTCAGTCRHHGGGHPPFAYAATPAGYGDVEREVESRGGTTLRNIREAICAIRRANYPTRR